MIVKAPFTQEQIDNINDYQKGGRFHPFTCMSYNNCKREENKWGELVATRDGLVCPCGKYKQDWVHDMMTQKQEPSPFKFKDDELS